MTEYQFETHKPVKLYVELGAGTVAVQAEETTESRVTVTGRDADRVMVEYDGDHLSVIAPKDRTGFLGAATASSTSRSRCRPRAGCRPRPAAPT